MQPVIYKHDPFTRVVAAAALLVAIIALVFATTLQAPATSLQAGAAKAKKKQISGKLIKNRSISSKKVKKKFVAPRATTANSVVGLSFPNAPIGAGRALAQKAATDQCVGPLCRLKVGQQNVPILESPPFTLTASCEDLGANNYRVSMRVSSTAAQWYGGNALGAHDPGEDVQVGPSINSNDVRVEDVGTAAFSEVTADPITDPPHSLILPSAQLAVHREDDCSVLLYGIGS